MIKNQVYCYSGTGNSLWVSQKLIQKMGEQESELIFINSLNEIRISSDVETVGFIFPVHMWGVPRRVLNLLDTLPHNEKRFYYAIAVNAGQVSRTLIQLNEVLQKKEAKLSLGFEIKMPSNYLPWGGALEEEQQNKLFFKAKEKLSVIAQSIKNKRTLPFEKGPLWQRIIFTGIYHLTFSKVQKLDENFWVNNSCNGCSLCQQICPAKNITLNKDKKPQWLHECEQCLACIQWCPQSAIEYGKKTRAYKRYHQPEISLAAMIVKKK